MKVLKKFLKILNNTMKINKYQLGKKILNGLLMFGNAQIAGESGPATSIAIASGWEYNPKTKKWEQTKDKINDPSVKALRNNLSILSTFSPTHPTTALIEQALIPGISFIGNKLMKHNPFKGPGHYMKMFKPHKAKQLDELVHQRQFKLENPLEYVSDRKLNKIIDDVSDGSNIFRVSREGGDSYNGLLRRNTSNESILMELQDAHIQEPLTWASIKPTWIKRYIKNGGREIHIQPESDFRYSIRQNENNVNTLNGYNIDTRIVSARDFDLNKGYHFIRIPGANQWAKYKPDVNYYKIINKPSYTSKLPEERTLFPGIWTNKNGINVHQAYKMAAITPPITAGVIGGIELINRDSFPTESSWNELNYNKELKDSINNGK